VDTVDFATTAAELTGETAEYVWETLSENVKGGTAELTVVSKDAKQIFDKFYGEQHAIYWPKIEPHYKEHVVPLIHQKDQLVKEFNGWKKKEIDPSLNEFQKEYNKKHVKAVQIYGEQCKSALESARTLDLPYFEEIDQYVDQSCSDPDTSVRYIRNGLIILVLLPFRRWILAPVYWVWGIVLWVLLTITPLGFFFSKKKKAAPATKDKAKAVNTNGVRVKKKGKNVAQ
jgi:hypothetical protein